MVNNQLYGIDISEDANRNGPVYIVDDILACNNGSSDMFSRDDGPNVNAEYTSGTTVICSDCDFVDYYNKLPCDTCSAELLL